MFAGALWLLRQSADSALMFGWSIRRSVLAPYLSLAAFLFVAALSMVMPVYISGRLQIASPELMDFTTAPLFFSVRNLTALLYLIFGGLVATSIAQVAQDRAVQREIDRLWLGVAAFMALWGLIQFTCTVAHLPFPVTLFNNNHSASVASAHPELDVLRLPRLNSVAVEPSILSQCLLVMLPMTLPAVLGIGKIFSLHRDRLIAWLIVLALVLTFSSVAYIGLAALALVAAFALHQTGLIRMWPLIKRTLLGVLLFLAIAVPTYLASGSVRLIVASTLISKAGGYSGLERLKTITNAANYFLEYPLLGVGWGSVTSHDLMFKLLANVGLLGAVTFGLIWWTVIRRNLGGRLQRSREERLRNMYWGVSACILIGASGISEFPYVFGYFWVVLGMCIAVGACGEKGSSQLAAERMRRIR